MPAGADIGGVGAFCLSELLVLSQAPEYTIFAASLLMPTPFHAVMFGDAPCYYAVIDRVMTLRATNLRTRRPRSAVQGQLAPKFRLRMLRHDPCRRQAPLHRASGVTRPQISSRNVIAQTFTAS
jgi:hypothetical protein